MIPTFEEVVNQKLLNEQLAAEMAKNIICEWLKKGVTKFNASGYEPPISAYRRAFDHYYAEEFRDAGWTKLVTDCAVIEIL